MLPRSQQQEFGTPQPPPPPPPAGMGARPQALRLTEDGAPVMISSTCAVPELHPSTPDPKHQYVFSLPAPRSLTDPHLSTVQGSRSLEAQLWQ